MVVQGIDSKEYGRSMSTVFGASEKRYAVLEEEDDDPVLEDLRILDYRYMRFSFHPVKDRFVLSNSWKDPAWTDVKSIRAGIDGDEKEIRELVFGKNLIDIKQKTIPQLLIDEVCALSDPVDSCLPYNRRFTLSTYFKLPVLFSGPLTNTTTTPPVSSSSL
jgi:cation-transporting ATPase 13A2